MLFFYRNPILIAAAVIPAVFLLIKVYRADRLEPEPPLLLLSLVLYGIVATGLASFTEQIGSTVLDRILPQNSLAYRAALYFVVVAFSEEGFKYLLLKMRTWRAPAFNCQFDGVVYAVFVSLGFALWENIGYVLRYGFQTAVLRAVTAVPGHACFGVFMGAWYGPAKRYCNMGRAGASQGCRLMAFLLPAFLHGSYDFLASVESADYQWIFPAFVAVLFLVAFLVVRNMSRHDRYITNGNTYYYW